MALTISLRVGDSCRVGEVNYKLLEFSSDFALLEVTGVEVQISRQWKELSPSVLMCISNNPGRLHWCRISIDAPKQIPISRN